MHFDEAIYIHIYVLLPGVYVSICELSLFKFVWSTNTCTCHLCLQLLRCCYKSYGVAFGLQCKPFKVGVACRVACAVAEFDGAVPYTLTAIVQASRQRGQLPGAVLDAQSAHKHRCPHGTRTWVLFFSRQITQWMSSSAGPRSSATACTSFSNACSFFCGSFSSAFLVAFSTSSRLGSAMWLCRRTTLCLGFRVHFAGSSALTTSFFDGCILKTLLGRLIMLLA